MTEKARKGEVQFSIKKASGKQYALIMRKERDDEESVAKYDEKAGIVEMLPGKEQHRTQVLNHINNVSKNFKECAVIGTDLAEIPEDAPPRPKKSRTQGQKTPKYVEWYAKWRKPVFLQKYKVKQFQIRVAEEEHIRIVRNKQTGAKEEEKYIIPKYEDEEGFDFSISKLKSGEHRLIAGCKTHLTFVYRDDSQSDEYDDDLDLEIMAEKEGEL